MGRVLEVCLVGLGGCLTSAAQADCPQGQDVFTSCQIEGRNTEVFVCYDDKIATYSYGPIGGKPDLLLSEAIARVDFEPWSGVGKAIAESVSFYNGDYSYEVGGGFDRPFSEEEMMLENRQFGWLDVARNGKSLGRLECVPETVNYWFGSGIYDAKVAAGLEWDDRSQTWVPGQNHPNRAQSCWRTNDMGPLRIACPRRNSNLAA